MKPAFTLPPLDRRFPSAIHPAVEEIEAEGLRWCTQFGMLASDEQTETFKLSRFGWLGARAYRRADLPELRLATHFLIWLFRNDDWTDTLTLEQMRDHQRHLFEALEGDGGPPRPSEAPTVSALRDVWMRTRDIAHPRCLQRFKHSIHEYVSATVWEAGNRQAHRFPDLETYQKMRLTTGAMATVIDLIEITQHICLSDEVLHHEAVQRLTHACGDLVNWSNDLVSMAREERQGDVHNLVLVLRHQHDLPLDEAMRRATALYNERLDQFVTMEGQLPSFGPSDAPLARYVAGLRDWIQGNHDWSYEDSLRYALD